MAKGPWQRDTKTKAITKEAAALHAAGHSLRKIGELLGVNAETVRRALNLAGVPMRSRLGVRKPQGEAPVHAEAVRLADEGMSTRKIAERLGIGSATVSRVVSAAAGVNRSPHKGIRADVVRKLWSEGHSKTFIARQLGCTISTVNHHLGELRSRRKS